MVAKLSRHTSSTYVSTLTTSGDVVAACHSEVNPAIRRCLRFSGRSCSFSADGALPQPRSVEQARA